ncbi:hypothetical protein [Yersinia ruckeri]|uniref:hypothetical protein n=1 Tax=Yersinia ruckeri TaxID=29486 RepID=UPI000B0CC9DC|nr:hypothetical protein [Yersinia ruckeri]MCW6567967.1 hypothetical protein [Yersinia ruckeri]
MGPLLIKTISLYQPQHDVLARKSVLPAISLAWVSGKTVLSDILSAAVVPTHHVIARITELPRAFPSLLLCRHDVAFDCH